MKKDPAAVTMRCSDLIKQAFIATIPVLTGYIVLGIGFGVIMKTEGFGLGLVFAMSALIFAGSLQYAAIDLLTSGVSLAATALTSLAVNFRYFFTGISMINQYKDQPKPRKLFLIFALTDETFSLVCNPPEHMGKISKGKWFFWVSLLNYCYWVTGSVLGVLLGEFIPFSSEGIEFSLTALFLTVFVEQWITSKDHGAAIIGVICSVLCLMIFGSERFLIPAMILITLFLTIMRRKEDVADE